MTHSMIQVNGITKTYGKGTISRAVLKNINLQFGPGKTHVILGPSGCGKSTLLRCIMGLVPIDRGNISFPDKTPAANEIGYVIQEGGLFPHLTALKNVTLMAQTHGWPADKIHQRVMDLTELVNLHSNLIERFPKQLSGGQRQRIGIMRALMLDPKYLFLDEPLGALDPLVRFDLQTQLRQIFQKLHRTVFLVTHDISEAAYFADTITLLKEGEVVQHGSFEDLVKKPQSDYVTEFINAQRPPPLLKELL